MELSGALFHLEVVTCVPTACAGLPSEISVTAWTDSTVSLSVLDFATSDYLEFICLHSNCMFGNTNQRWRNFLRVRELQRMFFQTLLCGENDLSGYMTLLLNLLRVLATPTQDDDEIRVRSQTVDTKLDKTLRFLEK